MSENAVLENVDTSAPAPAPSSAPAAAPTASAPAAAPSPAPAPAEAPTPAPAPSAPDPAEWRARAISQVFGEEKPDDAPETKAEREKMSKLAARYNTMGDALKALREAQVKISSGELKRALPKDAKPEQLAEWRKENGIPETPDKYDLGLPKDFEPTELSDALFGTWTAKAHALNAPPELVKAGTAAFFEASKAIEEQFNANNKAAEAETIETLRAEFGSDYKPNIDGIDSMLRQAGSDVVSKIRDARDANGVRLLNNPEILRWLSGHARELGYVGATVVPSGGDLGKTIESELDSLKQEMARDLDAWRANPKKAERYQQLLNSHNRLSGRK